MSETDRRKKSDRLLKLEQKRAALQRKIALEETRLKTQERKIDTRRKIIAGAIVLAHADMREAFRDILYELLQKFVEPKDKYLFVEVFTPEQIAQANSEAQQIRDERQARYARDQTSDGRHQQDTPPEHHQHGMTQEPGQPSHDDQAEQLPDASTDQDTTAAAQTLQDTPPASALDSLRKTPAPSALAEPATAKPKTPRKARTARNLAQLKKSAAATPRQKRQTLPKADNETLH